MPRTRAVALCALTVVLALPAAAAAVEGSTRVTGVVSTSATGDGADRTLVRKRKTVVLRSRAIPMSAPEIPNPMRGQYEWLGSSTVPAGFPTTDVYYRDQVAWKLIEPIARASTTSPRSTMASPGPVSWAAASASG